MLDNDVGKTNNLTVFEHLAYRALSNVAMTFANIYRFLGPYEEGQGIILEDEIDNIETHDDKMRIYKPGYQKGKKVTRNDDTTNGRKSQGYYTYSFKAFAAEKEPDNSKAKGFNERTFVIKCFPGSPEYDIGEVITPGDDGEYTEQYDELVEVRKLLFGYRLLHYNDPIPYIGLNVKNRDKQLCRQLIRVFQDTKVVNDILPVLSRLLKEKKQRKNDSFEARLRDIIEGLVKQAEQTSLDDEVFLTSESIWSRITGSDKVEATIPGEFVPGQSQTWHATEFGPITQTSIASIIKGRFGGENTKDSKGLRGFRFSRKKLARLGTNYSYIDGIKIVHSKKAGYGGSGGSGGFTEAFETTDTEKGTESCNSYNTSCKDIHEHANNIEDISVQTAPIDSESSYNPSNPPNPPCSQDRESKTEVRDDKSIESKADYSEGAAIADELGIKPDQVRSPNLIDYGIPDPLPHL